MSPDMDNVKDDKISLAGFYYLNWGANIAGFATIMFLNIFTPLDFFKIQRTFIFAQGGWSVFFLFIPFVFLLISLLQYRIQRPISNLVIPMNKGEEIPEKIHEKARQRLLNLPFLIALVNLTVYVSVPALMAIAFYFIRDIPAKTCLLLFIRAMMIGLVASMLSVFLIEAYSRKTMIPLLFPKGRLMATPGTIKISILRRIRLLNMAGTFNPMIILLITLLIVQLEIKGKTIPADQLGSEIFLFSIILCGIFVVIALSLNVLVGNSILHPIGEILGVIERVKSGDFNRRIRVVSNDEIGELGDAGNDMIRELAERERIKETFGKYVTPEIRDQILAGEIPLDGELRVATLLFSDLRNFTSYVEENPPKEVIRGMRAYFTAMQKAVRNQKGLVLQYVGDEIEAVFGVPLRYKDHADKALHAALEMRNNLEELNRIRQAHGKPPFRHGIGIYTGTVLAGNTGSDDRLSYTLIGNAVNLASRIQELTKTIKCDILASEETVKNLESSFHMKKEEPLEVKGYSASITVYQVL
ncbi:adenylate/guanylate cyclase domain-containing protein [Thermodesulfobacteriota bacterium]